MNFLPDKQPSNITKERGSQDFPSLPFMQGLLSRQKDLRKNEINIEDQVSQNVQARFRKQFNDPPTFSIIRQESESVIKIRKVLERIEELSFCILGSVAVQIYLSQYFDLIESLLPICKIVRTKFKEPTELSLMLYQDKENADSYLTIYVRQKEYSTTIIDEIDELFLEYEPYLVGKSGWIVVTTDFRCPI